MVFALSTVTVEPDSCEAASRQIARQLDALQVRIVQASEGRVFTRDELRAGNVVPFTRCSRAVFQWWRIATEPA